MEAHIDGDVHIFDKTRVGKITFFVKPQKIHVYEEPITASNQTPIKEPEILLQADKAPINGERKVKTKFKLPNPHSTATSK
jgi:hypothetical protein